MWCEGTACSLPVPKLQIRDCPGRNLMDIYGAHNETQLQTLWSTQTFEIEASEQPTFSTPEALY